MSAATAATDKPVRRGLMPDGTLDARDNSLNVIRLVLAWSVLLSHSYPIAGDGHGPGWKGENLGGWAVIGFFVISGYLIAGSRRNNSTGPYLVNRVARIFPGYLLALVVVAFGFAPIEYYVQRGSLAGFWSTPPTPLNFIFDNLLLDVKQYGIAGGPTIVPYTGVWNGSLWTLWFEFFCYLIIAVLMAFPVARRRAWPVAVVFVASTLGWAFKDTLFVYLGGYHVTYLLKLAPYFMGGALIAMLKRKLPLRTVPALLAWAAGFALVAVVPAWGGQAAAPLFCYGVLWLSSVLPRIPVTQVHDISYGVYVYAWPSTIASYALGMRDHGVFVYVLVATVFTVILATASWFAVERPSMRIARGQPAFGK